MNVNLAVPDYAADALWTALNAARAAPLPPQATASSSSPGPQGPPAAPSYVFPDLAPAAPPAVPHAITFTVVQGRRIDDVVPPGTPGTDTVPLTNHTISRQQSVNGEALPSYCLRVCKQCGIDVQTGIYSHFAINQFASNLKTYGPTPDSWMLMVDEFWNQPLYNPVSDAQKALIAKEWADAQALLRQQGAPPDVGPAITEVPGNAP